MEITFGSIKIGGLVGELLAHIASFIKQFKEFLAEMANGF